MHRAPLQSISVHYTPGGTVSASAPPHRRGSSRPGSTPPDEEAAERRIDALGLAEPEPRVQGELRADCLANR
jgi:hypothetical protein